MEPFPEGLVLAAGLSSRMGRQKLLLDVGGAPMVVRVVRAALASSLRRVVVVGGPCTDLVETLVSARTEPRLTVTVNPNPEQGMSSSLRAGLACLSPGASGVMVILGDQPFLTSDVIDRLIAAFRSDSDKIVVPSVMGRRSNPVLFPADLFPDLARTRGDVGGRFVLKRNARRIVRIEVGDTYDDSDVDTPQDLKRLTRKVRSGTEDAIS